MSATSSPSRDLQPMAAADMQAGGLVERCRWCASGRVSTVRVPISSSRRCALHGQTALVDKCPSIPSPSYVFSTLDQGQTQTDNLVHPELDDAPIPTSIDCTPAVNVESYRPLPAFRNLEHSPQLFETAPHMNTNPTAHSHNAAVFAVSSSPPDHILGMHVCTEYELGLSVRVHT